MYNKIPKVPTKQTTNVKILPTWKNRPLIQKVRIGELPSNMKLHRTIFTQVRIIEDAKRLDYPNHKIRPQQRKLATLKNRIGKHDKEN